VNISQSVYLAGLTPAPSSATSELPSQYDLISVVAATQHDLGVH
jgi:hypothetical protein